MAKRQPAARISHAAAGEGHSMLVWAGKDRGRFTSKVESFDLLSLSWKEPRQLHGDNLPRGLASMAVASDGREAYLFGGTSLKGFEDKLFSVDLSSLQCRELIQRSYVSPKGREGCAMVLCEKKLVLYGGFSARGVSDGLYVFDFESGILAIAMLCHILLLYNYVSITCDQ